MLFGMILFNGQFGLLSLPLTCIESFVQTIDLINASCNWNKISAFISDNNDFISTRSGFRAQFSAVVFFLAKQISSFSLRTTSKAVTLKCNIHSTHYISKHCMGNV